MQASHLLELILTKKVFDIFIKTGKMQRFIYESTLKIGEELKKNKMIEDLERSVKIIKMG